MPLAYEIQIEGTNLYTSDYGYFTIVKNGIVGLADSPPLRQELIFVPGKDYPYVFGGDYGEKHIIVTGLMVGTTRALLDGYISSLKGLLSTYIDIDATLIFGGNTEITYEVRWDGTCKVAYIGSTLISTKALVTIGLLQVG